MVVLDTCCLIEICKNKVEISDKTLRQIVKGAIVLSISFAEIACKVKLGKLEMTLSPQELYERFQQIENLTIVDISPEDWIDAVDLEWPTNKDPADRLLVAYAKRHKQPIVTSDAKIKDFYKKVIW